jgi:hypothetical protein
MNLKKGAFILIFLVILFLLTSCSNGRNHPTTGTQSIPNEPQKITANAINTGYGISSSNYVDQGVKIAYPQITNLSDVNKQNTLNNLIKTEALKGLNYYAGDHSKLTLEINYEIKLKDANLLSIQYSGVGYVTGDAYPNNLFYTTNIDLNKDKKLNLTDIVHIDHTFVKKFRNGQFSAVNPDQSSLLNNLSDNDLLNDINNADDLDSVGTDRETDTYSYLTKNSLGISFSVNHAAGDHAEFEIDSSNIKDYLKIVL